MKLPCVCFGQRHLNLSHAYSGVIDVDSLVTSYMCIKLYMFVDGAKYFTVNCERCYRFT